MSHIKRKWKSLGNSTALTCRHISINCFLVYGLKPVDSVRIFTSKNTRTTPALQK